MRIVLKAERSEKSIRLGLYSFHPLAEAIILERGMLVPPKAEGIHLGRAEDLFEFIGIRDPLVRASRIYEKLLGGVLFVCKIKELDLLFQNLGRRRCRINGFFKRYKVYLFAFKEFAQFYQVFCASASA